MSGDKTQAPLDTWLADCHFQSVAADNDGAIKEYRARAAVWADSPDAVRALIDAHAAKIGLEVLWLEEVLPVAQYLSRHPAEQHRIGALARSVSAMHRVELAKLTEVGSEAVEEPEDYLTITEHEIPPLPDQDRIPFWEQEWIAPELKELLFGRPETAPRLRTYFIVDATLRKNITGFFDLDSLDVPVQCLFKGNAAEDLKEVAPYLIDMTLPEGAFDKSDSVPAFHKDFFKKHWGQNTGIFIRSSATMQDIRNHFRKFTKVFDKRGKGYFFRFWDSRIASYYFSGIKDIEQKIVDWFTVKNDIKINAIIMENGEGEKKYMLDMKPLDTLNSERAKFVFTQYEWDLMSSFVEERFYQRILQSLCNDFPEKEREAIKSVISHNRKIMKNFNLIDERDIYALNRVCIKWGEKFYTSGMFQKDFERIRDNRNRLGKYMRLWAS